MDIKIFFEGSNSSSSSSSSHFLSSPSQECTAMIQTPPPFQLHQQYLPHAIYAAHQPPPPPPPPPTVVHVSFASPQPSVPPQPPYFYYHNSVFVHSSQGFFPHGGPSTGFQQPLSFPATGYSYSPENAAHFFGGGVVMKTWEKPSERIFGHEKVERSIVESSSSPKSPKVGVGRMCVPPLLMRATRSFHVDKKPASRHVVWRARGTCFAAGGAASPEKPCAAVAAAAGSDEVFSPSAKTTVMIKNIPNQIRRDFMLGFVDSCCKTHLLEYDFLYLPMDFSKHNNLGYAFVNFTTADSALRFKDILQGYKWDAVEIEKGTFKSKKVCDVTWARIQGREGLVKRFQNSKFACENLDFLPVILDPPRNGSDPTPAPPVNLGRLQQWV